MSEVAKRNWVAESARDRRGVGGGRGSSVSTKSANSPFSPLGTLGTTGAVVSCEGKGLAPAPTVSGDPHPGHTDDWPKGRCGASRDTWPWRVGLVVREEKAP